MVATRVSAWLPVAVWAGVIFALSSIPSLGTGLGLADLVLRKIAHGVEFAALGALLYRATSREAWSIGFGALYAASDEVHQAFVAGRVASATDWVIDVAGLVVGVAAMRAWRNR